MEELPRRKHYFYLLHLWQERPPRSGSPGIWRITLEGARHGERRGFASLEELVAFLRAEIMGELDGEPGGD
ncbi:MAG: hypothetical protein ACE5LU_24710 [Anaerolineae bacterium]